MEWLLVAFILVFGLCKYSLGQNVVSEVAQERFCQSYTTCDSCVQAEFMDFSCVWCYQEDFASDRCGPESALRRNGCAEKYIFFNNENSTIVSTDSDRDFHDVTNPDNVEESVQIKPQKITVRLQPGQPLSFQFKYRLAKNYPLDLYYLMDLTYTMEHDVTTMATLGRELTEVLQNLTRHFKVAFGYYSDKVAMPFSRMTDEFLENPCSESGKQCRKGFDFVHSLNFTSDIQAFIGTINGSRITSNLDNLEGGMDALHQIILCEEYIQWRKNSRRMIVVATDGILHFAGDGILAGAVKRNSDQCLLDENGIYSQSLLYDYPSLEEVYRRSSHNKMNILFAAKEDALEYYKKLNKAIPSISYVGKLEEKSTNVLKLVEEGYFNVVRKVEFSTTPSENLKVTFKANCNKMRAWNMSSMCDNVEVGKEYIFDVTLEVLQIPKDIETETIVIEEKTIAETLIIEVQYIGKCKCNMEVQNKRCSNHGSYKCGVCECDEEWKGENCERECVDQRFEECRYRNDSYTSSTCLGRGDCDCGRCMCDEEYTGKFCEEKQCPKDRHGQVCGGYLHGICQDGVCECAFGFEGEDCSCPKSENNCKAPGAEETCSGKGYCRCGKCICNQNYNGDYCELCPTCIGSSELCSSYEDCVLDTLANITHPDKCFKSDGTAYMTKIVNYTLAVDTTTCYAVYDKKDGYRCSAQYNYNIRKDFIVDLLIHNDCQKPIQAYTVLGIIVGAIVGIGILFILIWKAKLLTDDRREYAQFQENVNRNKMLAENPLYNSPIRTYEMPAEFQNFRANSDNAF